MKSKIFLQKRNHHLLILLFSFILLTSCSRSYFAWECLSGTWIIDKVEVVTYKGGSITNTVTYADSCGYILLFNGTPGHVYSVINYPSKYLSTDENGNWDAFDWEDGYFSLTLNSREMQIPFEDYESRKQVWQFGYNTDGEMEIIYLSRE